MARLPDSLPMGVASGPRPQAPDTDWRDLNLGVSAVLGTINAEGERRGDEEATRLMSEFQTGFQARAAERAAAYDGSAPGFAQAEAAAWDQEFGAVLGDRKSWTRQALKARGDQARAAFLSSAINVEAQKRAGIVAARREAIDTQTMGQAQQTYLGRKTDLVNPVYDRFDGADPASFVPDVMARTDEALAKGRETVPERLLPQYDAWAAGERLNEQARALKVRETREEAQLTINASRTVQTATSQVLRDPSLYEANSSVVDTAINSLPADQALALRPKVQEELAVAYVQGLALNDRRDEAKAAIQSGRFDGIIPTDSQARLLASLERKTVADAMKEDDVRARAQSDVAATASGASPGNTNVGEVEAVLGPDAAADYQREKAAAAKLYGMVGPLHELDDGAIADRRAALRPDPKAPTYAADLKAYQIFNAAADAELKARRDDPAAWALSAGEGGGGSPSDVLRRKFDGWANGKPEEKAKLAQDYGRAMLARQEQAGVAPQARRVLPKSVAGAWAADARSEDPKVRRTGLDRISRVLQQFGPYRSYVARELTAAGLPARDLEAAAAAIESGNDAALGVYAAATDNGKATKALDGKQDKRLKEEVLRQTRPYLDSLAPLDPARRRENVVIDSVLVQARGLVLNQGMDPKEAVETAMKVYDRFEYRGGLRIPKGVAPRGKGDPNLRLIEGGGKVVLKGVTGDGGKWLKAPAGTPPDVYADTVRERAIWVTTPDDAGVVLMILTPAGPKAVLDNRGNRITRNWDELIERGRKAAPRSSIGRLPTG